MNFYFPWLTGRNTITPATQTLTEAGIKGFHSNLTYKCDLTRPKHAFNIQLQNTSYQKTKPYDLSIRKKCENTSTFFQPFFAKFEDTLSSKSLNCYSNIIMLSFLSPLMKVNKLKHKTSIFIYFPQNYIASKILPRVIPTFMEKLIYNTV